MILRWLTEFEGSTRAVGLVRILLVFVIWVRYGRELALHSGRDPEFILLAFWFFIFTPMMLVGYMTRVSVVAVGFMLAVMYFFFGVAFPQLAWTSHHNYMLMIAVILLALTPCGRSYSVDRYREVRDAERTGAAPRAEHGPLWGARLIVLQMSALYFWTAVDKSDWAWISGQRLEALLMWFYEARPLETVVLNPALLVIAAIAVLVVEYFLAVAIHVRRWHFVAVPLGVALHGMFFILLPLMTYSATMMALYLLVVHPDAVHRCIDRLHGMIPAK